MSDPEFSYALVGLGYQEVLKHTTRLEERFVELAEKQHQLEERLGRLDCTLATVVHRLGVLSEHASREAMRGTRGVLRRYCTYDPSTIAMVPCTATLEG